MISETILLTEKGYWQIIILKYLLSSLIYFHKVSVACKIGVLLPSLLEKTCLLVKLDWWPVPLFIANRGQASQLWAKFKDSAKSWINLW